MFEIYRIKAKNFVLYENLDIQFSFLNDNLVFITGNNLDVSGTDSNGSGKTLIGDLVSDLLFDKTVRGHSQASFIGKFEKHCRTEIRVRDQILGISYIISKYRNHPVHKDKTFFYSVKNKKKTNLSRKKKADTYKVIWKTLGLNWLTFKNLNYFAQDDAGRFLNVTDAKKAEILIDLQGLQSLEEARKEARDRIKDLKKDLDLAKNSREQESFSLTKSNDLLKVTKKDLNSRLSKEKDNLKNLKKKKLKVEKEEASSVNADLSTLSNKIKELSDKINKLNGSHAKWKGADVNLKSFEIKMKKIAMEQSKKSSKRKDLLEEISDIEPRLIAEKNGSVKTCERCGASLTDSRRKTSIESLETRKKILILEEVSIEKNLKELSKEEKSLSVLLKKAELEVLKFEEDRKKRSEYLHEVSELKDEQAKVEAIKNRKDLLDSLIASSETSINEIKNSPILSGIKKSIKKAEKNLEKRDAQISKLEDEIKKNEFAVKVYFKTLRRMFSLFISSLNKNVSILLDELCDNDIDVRFKSKTERKSKKVVDELSVMVSVNGETPRNFKTYSGGEKGRIELVCHIALFLSSDSPLGFMFLDEPFTGIDLTGRGRITDMLNDISSKGNKVLVTSNKNVSFGYGSTLEVTLKNGRSEIHGK